MAGSVGGGVGFRVVEPTAMGGTTAAAAGATAVAVFALGMVVKGLILVSFILLEGESTDLDRLRC